MFSSLDYLPTPARDGESKRVIEQNLREPSKSLSTVLLTFLHAVTRLHRADQSSQRPSPPYHTDSRPTQAGNGCSLHLFLLLLLSRFHILCSTPPCTPAGRPPHAPHPLHRPGSAPGRDWPSRLNAAGISSRIPPEPSQSLASLVYVVNNA